MSDYFRHGRIVPAARPSGLAAPRPLRSARISGSRRRRALHRSVQAARNPASWLGAFQAALDSGTEVSEEALSCIQQHVDRDTARMISLPARRGSRCAAAFSKPRAGSLRPALADARLRAAPGAIFPEFHGDLPGASSATSITLSLSTSTRCWRSGNLERLVTHRHLRSDAVPDRSSDLQEPELLVLALLFHDVGKWRDDDHALESVRWPSMCLERLQVTRQTARDCSFSDSPPSADVDRRLRRDTEDPTCREAVRRARSGYRGAAEDALPHDARRHRGGQSPERRRREGAELPGGASTSTPG